MTREEREAKALFVGKQFRETITSIEEHGTSMVTCGCGLHFPLRFAYRCYYCGEYYCEKCAPVHFGKTREEYNRERDLVSRNAATTQRKPEGP